MTDTKPTMLVFMGGQGAGKGTYARLLMNQHEYNYVETGAMLRKMPTDSIIGQKILRGELVNDEDLFQIMSDAITTDRDIIIDGFPRTIGQAEWIVQNYSDKFDIKIVFLNISEEKMYAHIQNRIAEGQNRADDNDENAVRKRIESFKTVTLPTIEWLRGVDTVHFYDIKLPTDDIDTNFAYVVEKLSK